MKALKTVWNAITTVLVALVVVLAILLVGVRVVGLTPYVVLSGSMSGDAEDHIEVGDLIFVGPVEDPATLETGDVIAFMDGTVVVTHRIIEVKNEKGTLSFVTKGDANGVADAAPVSPAQIIGTPVFTVPYLGYLSVFLQTRSGRFASIGAGLFLLLLIFLPDLLQETKSK